MVCAGEARSRGGEELSFREAQEIHVVVVFGEREEGNNEGTLKVFSPSALKTVACHRSVAVSLGIRVVPTCGDTLPTEYHGFPRPHFPLPGAGGTAAEAAGAEGEGASGRRAEAKP